jgi:hypothetical protein
MVIKHLLVLDSGILSKSSGGGGEMLDPLPRVPPPSMVSTWHEYHTFRCVWCVLMNRILLQLSRYRRLADRVH